MMWCATSGRGAPGGRHPGRGGPGGAGAAGGALAGHPDTNIFKVFQIFLQICIIDVFPNSIQLVTSNNLQFSQLHLKRLHILFSIESENFPWPLHPSITAPAQHISFLHPAQLHSHSTATAQQHTWPQSTARKLQWWTTNDCWLWMVLLLLLTLS